MSAEDDDPLAAMRRSISTNTKSRVSTRPIDSTEDTFMGASIGAKPEADAPSEPAKPLIGKAPRRRQKKAGRSALAIDPAELAQFASTVGGGAPADTAKEEAKTAPTGGLILSSPSPPQADTIKSPALPKSPLLKSPSPASSPVRSPVGSPILPALSPVKTPIELPVSSPVKSPLSSPRLSPVIAAPSPVKSPIKSPLISKFPTPPVSQPSRQTEQLEKQLAESNAELLSQSQVLSDYNALSENLLDSGTAINAENLALFLQPRLDRAAMYDTILAEKEALLKEVADLKQSLATVDLDDPTASGALSQANLAVAELSEERDALKESLELSQRLVDAKEREIGELRQRLSEASSEIKVASLEELDSQMQVRFKQTTDFIKEMEEFLSEHQVNGGQSIEEAGREGATL